MSTAFAAPSYRFVSVEAPAAAREGVVSTTLTERTIIAVAACMLPFDDHLPTIAGISMPFLWFAVMAGYAMVLRGTSVAAMLWHPLFVAGTLSIVISALIEALHRNADYTPIIRTAFMYAGGVLMGALCRDRKAVLAAMYGLITGCVALSIMLLTSGYGILSAASAVNFKKAGLVRAKVAENVSVGGDLNMLAFYAAMGAAIALGFGMGQRSRFRALIFIGAAGVCALGTFVPMSRGGMGILVLASLVALRARGLRLTTVLGAMAAGLIVMTFVPNVVFSRMDMSQGGRVTVYTAVRDNIPEYAVVGVGAGNYWSGWAYSHGIRSLRGPLGTHNTFLQALVYWGILGLASLSVVVVLAWRYTPKDCQGDDARIALRTFAFAIFVYLFLSHTLQDKQFSMGLALLAASSRWIWPVSLFNPRETSSLS